MRGILLLSAISCSSLPMQGQVFLLTRNTPASPNAYVGYQTGFMLNGELAVDAVQGTSSFTGTLGVESGGYGSSYQGKVVTEVTPGVFPNPDTVTHYTSVLSVTWTVSATSRAITIDPIVPTRIGISTYSLQVPASQALTFQMAFEYTLMENNVPVSSGSGSYPLTGKPDALTFSITDFPASLPISLEEFRFSPEPGVAFSVTTPHGVTFNINRASYPTLGPVPEPSEYALVSGLGLVALGIVRRLTVRIRRGPNASLS